MSEQQAITQNVIFSRLSVLGSDGTTFRPGSLFYVAMYAALETGNNQLSSAHRIDVNAVLPDICEGAHRGVQYGKDVYYRVDDIFFDLFMGDIYLREEYESFDPRSAAYEAAIRSFSDHLDLSADWIHLIADEREAQLGK